MQVQILLLARLRSPSYRDENFAPLITIRISILASDTFDGDGILKDSSIFNWSLLKKVLVLRQSLFPLAAEVLPN